MALVDEQPGESARQPPPSREGVRGRSLQRRELARTYRSFATHRRLVTSQRQRARRFSQLGGDEMVVPRVSTAPADAPRPPPPADAWEGAAGQRREEAEAIETG